MFKAVAGSLGWPPEVILNTNISQLEMAVEGKIDFVKKTNPFGSGEPTEAEKLKNQPLNAQQAAAQLMSFVKRRQGFDAQQRRKRRRK